METKKLLLKDIPITMFYLIKRSADIQSERTKNHVKSEDFIYKLLRTAMNNNLNIPMDKVMLFEQEPGPKVIYLRSMPLDLHEWCMNIKEGYMKEYDRKIYIRHVVLAVIDKTVGALKQSE